jgi:hypothetical protein
MYVPNNYNCLMAVAIISSVHPLTENKIRGVRAHVTVDTLRSTGVQKLGWMALYVVGRRAFRPLPSLSHKRRVVLI